EHGVDEDRLEVELRDLLPERAGALVRAEERLERRRRAALGGLALDVGRGPRREVEVERQLERRRRRDREPERVLRGRALLLALALEEVDPEAVGEDVLELPARAGLRLEHPERARADLVRHEAVRDPRRERFPGLRRVRRRLGLLQHVEELGALEAD